MIKVLFVCLGNICRSPMAEGVFKQLIEAAELSDKVCADSAGTASYHIGSLPDKRTMQVCLERGIKLTHRARALARQDFDEFDYIIAMDISNKMNIERLRPSHGRAAILLMREFDSAKNVYDVPDPYYDDIEKFYEINAMLDECCRNFINYLSKQYQFNV